jgi:ribonuclease HI
VIAENSKLVKKTSSNRMEFQAAIEALTSLPEKTRARLYTDSSILIDAVTRWAPIWETHEWEKENGSPIPNVDLIKTLHELNQKHRIEWKWVKAHSGIEFNERCDQLCIQARVEV